MANFKFDLPILLQLVEQRPCLWDKTSEQYKNRIARERNWEEIAQILDDDYDEKPAEEKKQTGESIQQKWANIRDAFMRSLKTKNGQPAKKKYLYAEYLQFLLKSFEPSDTESNSHAQDMSISEDQPSCSPLRTKSYTLHPSSKVTKYKRDLDLKEKEILLEMKKAKHSDAKELITRPYPPALSSEEMYFASFQPYISDMSEDEKLHLHMDIITAIREIKQRRISTTQPVISYITATSPGTSNDDVYE